jgi:hypothetical protein
VVGVIAALGGANVAGVSTAGLTDADTISRLPREFARGWFAVSEEAALGFAIATVARSQLAGIGVGIAFYFGEAFAGLFLPDIVRYMPFAVANASVAIGGDGGGPGGGGGGIGVVPLEPDTALALVGVWLVASLVVALAYTERAEIT